MKNRWWAVPLLMLISAWLCAAIRELLVFKPQLSKTFSDVLLPIACFVAVGFILRALCTKQAIRTGAMVVLGFSLIHLALAFVAPHSPLAWPSFLWEHLYFLFLSLPVDQVIRQFLHLSGPIRTLLPVLIVSFLPLLWIPFGRKRS